MDEEGFPGGHFFMRLERLSNNKIKIFFTFDDLFDRGVTKEEIRGNSIKVHKLFQDMVEEACEELDFDMSGSIAIEIISLQAQGLVIIVTKEEEDTLTDEEDYLNLKVKMDDCPYILFFFQDIEDVIQLCYRLRLKEISVSSLYLYDDQYYLLLEDIQENFFDAISSLAAEYGRASTLTLYRINEYGKCLIPKEAITTLTGYFRK